MFATGAHAWSSPYRDLDHFDRLQDARAEHAAETGEPMTLAEAMRRLVIESSPAPGIDSLAVPSRGLAPTQHHTAPVADDTPPRRREPTVPNPDRSSPHG